MRTLVERAQAIAANRDAGASEIVGILLPLLSEALEQGVDATLAIARIVCRGQPAMAPVWNACAAAVADAERPGRFRQARAEIERGPASLVSMAAPVLAEALAGIASPQILTVSYSASVARVLDALIRRGPMRVVCGEGRPRYEGRRLAVTLASAGAEVTMTTDAALTSFLSTTHAILVGADAVGARSWINKVGTRGLAAAAALSGVPVYVVATRDKALAKPLADRWIGVEGAAEEIWADAPPELDIRNPYFEPTPVELATIFLTDVAAIAPPDIGQWAERTASDVTLLLSYLP